MNMLYFTYICNFKVRNEFALIENPRNKPSHAYLFSEIRFMRACILAYIHIMHECMNILQIWSICDFKVKNEFAMVKYPRNKVSQSFLQKSLFMHPFML